MSSLRDNTWAHLEQTLSPFLFEEGLEHEEALVYQALLRRGNRPASIIAKDAGLKRAHTYNILERLMQRGLVQEYSKSKVRHFALCSPQVFSKILTERKHKISEQESRLQFLLPYLESLLASQQRLPRVQFFRGEEGIRGMYEATLACQEKCIYALGDFEHTFPQRRSAKLHAWMWEYAKRRAKKKILYRGILNKSSLSDEAYRKRKSERRELRMLNDVYLPVEINIYDSCLAFMSTAEDMSGVLIDDEHIASTLKNLYCALWPLLPPYQ